MCLLHRTSLRWWFLTWWLRPIMCIISISFPLPGCVRACVSHEWSISLSLITSPVLHHSLPITESQRGSMQNKGLFEECHKLICDMWVGLWNDITHRLFGDMKESSWEETALHFDLISSLCFTLLLLHVGAGLAVYQLKEVTKRRGCWAKPRSPSLETGYYERHGFIFLCFQYYKKN